MAYDANKDYTKAIQDAIASGATAAQINQLNAERNEKIAASGGALNQYQNDVADLVKPYQTSTKVSYIDGNGDKQTGYVINGKTYTDEAGSNRIGTGSVVQTNNGLYRMTENGGQKLGANEAAIYTDYLNRAESPQLTALKNQLSALEESLAQAQSTNDSVYTAQLQAQQENIKNQIAQLTSRYNAANKQLYVDAMKSKRDLPQALAALGYTGGLRESSLLGIDTDYANALNNNEIAKAGDIASLESGANTDATNLYIAQLQAQQDAQDTYTTRYLNMLQAMAEQEAEDRESAKESLAARLATVSTPSYTAAKKTDTDESAMTDSELKFYDVARDTFYKIGEDAAVNYLQNRVMIGALTREQAEKIANKIGSTEE